MRSKKDIQLINELEVAAKQQGFDLVDIERTGSGRNSLLRVFIDKEGGLNLDEIAAASAWVSEVIEGMDVYKSSYTLEVSSPGIDRPLRTLEHFAKAKGEEVVIQLDSKAVQESGSQSDKNAAEAKPRLNYTGLIVEVDKAAQNILLEVENETHTIAYDQIKKAKVKGRIDFEGRKTL